MYLHCSAVWCCNAIDKALLPHLLYEPFNTTQHHPLLNQFNHSVYEVPHKSSLMQYYEGDVVYSMSLGSVDDTSWPAGHTYNGDTRITVCSDVCKSLGWREFACPNFQHFNTNGDMHVMHTKQVELLKWIPQQYIWQNVASKVITTPFWLGMWQ